MIKSGFFSIPRSLTTDPRFKSAPIKYKIILFTIIENVAFSPTTQSNGSKIVKVEIGQLYASEDMIVDLCNFGVKIKDEKIEKHHVNRAIAFFKKCDFVHQEVHHGRNMLTISIPEFYKKEKTSSASESVSEVHQTCIIKEQHKEHKQEKNNNKEDVVDSFEKDKERLQYCIDAVISREIPISEEVMRKQYKKHGLVRFEKSIEKYYSQFTSQNKNAKDPEAWFVKSFEFLNEGEET